MTNNYRLNLFPSPVDPAHWIFEPQNNPGPDVVDLRKTPDAFPPIFDQGELNSCTANAVSAALYYDMNWQHMARHSFFGLVKFLIWDLHFANEKCHPR